MRPDQLYSMAMRRGDAGRVGRELGYSGREVPRRWCRPLAGPNNLFTGELSPVMKARAELLAEDRVNENITDTLLFDLFAAVARQRAQRAHLVIQDDDAVLIALTQSYHRAIDSVLGETDPRKKEEMIYRAGADLVQALLLVIGDDGAAVPLLRVDDERTWFARLRRRVDGQVLIFLMQVAIAGAIGLLAGVIVGTVL